jgi:four helix bundle protein
MKSVIKEKSFGFALRIFRLYNYLVETKRDFILSRQVLRSGTAPGALIREAQNAESKLDFIHKLSIAQKECDETLYWLELLHSAALLNLREFESIHHEANELLKIIRSAILTTRQNIKRKNS